MTTRMCPGSIVISTDKWWGSFTRLVLATCNDNKMCLVIMTKKAGNSSYEKPTLMNNIVLSHETVIGHTEER